MNIAVIDDKEDELEFYSTKIEASFSKIQFNVKIMAYQHVQDLKENIHNMDVVFLDVEMPEQDGITLAREIRACKPNMIIVFLSNYDSYVWDSFSVQAIYFIRKRYFLQEIASITDKIKEVYDSLQKEQIVIRDGKNITTLAVYEIQWVEAQKKKIHIVTSDSEYLLTYQFSKIEKDLNGYGFLKPHRSFLVNYQFIQQLLPDTIIMQSSYKIPVSKYRRWEIREQYLELLGEV